MFARNNKNYVFIGNENILFVDVGKNMKNKFKINKILQREIPDGILDRGKIIRKNRFLRFVREMGDDFDIQGRKVKIVLPDDIVGSKFFQIPAVKKAEINDYLEVEAERISDYKLNETLVDYSIVGKEEENINLHLATVKKDIISNYQEVIWKVFKSCQGITFRADTIWPVLYHICGSEKIILLELYNDITYISAGRSKQIYLYWQKNYVIDSLTALQKTTDEVDTYSSQEMNLEAIKKIYIWDAKNEKFDYPQINGGHRWHPLSLADLNIRIEGKIKQLYNLNTDHFLPLMGMMIREF